MTAETRLATALGALRRRPRGRAAVRSVARPALGALRVFNSRIRYLGAVSHGAQFQLERAAEPDRRWFDHHVDVHWRWAAGHSVFLERGVLNAIGLKSKSRVLDICCGDGFYTTRFYAGRAREVIGLDRDPDVLRHARARNGAANVTFEVADVRRELPGGPFDNVIWDASLQYFSDEDAHAVLRLVTRALRSGGVLSGYSEGLGDPAEMSPYVRDGPAVRRLLADHFAHVALLRLDHPARAGYHFFASDDESALAPLGRVDGAE